ncbi:hypothetical protein PspLS_10609 [Pyricularia sp. CBS 133598]|nr:hypothetical protein PspLS_10609 [Pyricularia sp. CBS 133598]
MSAWLLASGRAGTPVRCQHLHCPSFGSRHCYQIHIPSCPFRANAKDIYASPGRQVPERRYAAHLTQDSTTGRDMLVAYLDHLFGPGTKPKFYKFLLMRVFHQCIISSSDEHWWNAAERLVTRWYYLAGYTEAPLVTAIQARSVRLVKLLLDNGADVHGTSCLRKLVDEWLPIEKVTSLVFKAKIAMAKSKDPDITKEIEIMDLLLLRVANIDTWTMDYWTRPTAWYRRSITTPLMVFLHSMKWRGEPGQDVPSLENLICILKLLEF